MGGQSSQRVPAQKGTSLVPPHRVTIQIWSESWKQRENALPLGIALDGAAIYHCIYKTGASSR